MDPPKLTEAVIRAAASSQSFERGRLLYEEDAISRTAMRGDRLSGDCEGTQEPFYRVEVTLDAGGVSAASCTCPYDWGGLCKHEVALLLAYLHHPEQFIARPEPAELLADLDRDALAALLTRLLTERPQLQEWVEAAIATPSPASAPKQARRKPVNADAYRRQVIGILHSLDGMRSSEAYWQVGGLVNQLNAVKQSAMSFLEAGDAETALAILLVLLDETGHGIEYLDDSDGEVSGFVNDLGQPLAEAILSLEMNPAERDELAQQLEEKAGYLVDYGMDEGIDLALQAVTVYWDAEHPLERTGTPAGKTRDDDDDWEEDWGSDGINPFGDLTEARLNVLQRQGRTDEYLALCRQTGRHLRYALMLGELGRVPEAIAYANTHLSAADDARQMAERLRGLGLVAEATALAEYGLTLEGSKLRLGEWLGQLEEAQGRAEQAYQAWLAAFGAQPSLQTYETLKRLAANAWAERQPHLMAILNASHDPHTLVQVLLLEEDWDAAIQVAEGQSSWYAVVETVADALVTRRPEWVARVSVAHAERLMVEPKSKNYPLAAAWLRRAKQAYIHLGRTQEWQAYLQQLKEEYRRRPALQQQLRLL
jgi:uncharacterized Zn finger protein